MVKITTYVLAIILGLIVFGCIQNIDVNEGDLVKNQNSSNKTIKNDSDEIKIVETTQADGPCGLIAVGNIYKDNDGVLRATLVPEDGKQHRVAKGAIINVSKGSIRVKDIVELPSKSNMPGGSASYVVVECLSNSKPYAAPEGINASEINKPNLLNESEGELTTIKGTAEETKEGIYVSGVLVKLDNASAYAGKIVQVTGYLKTGTGTGGIDPKTGEVSQGYEGEYEYMTEIIEIKIING
ncbi:MAG: hypothetical protein WC589_24575 [Sphingobacterium sp.]